MLLLIFNLGLHAVQLVLRLCVCLRVLVWGVSLNPSSCPPPPTVLGSDKDETWRSESGWVGRGQSPLNSLGGALKDISECTLLGQVGAGEGGGVLFLGLHLFTVKLN